jgi:hypothetical protein
MFALIAAFCFLLAFFGVTIGDHSLMIAGLFFIALALMFNWAPWAPYLNRRNPQ